MREEEPILQEFARWLVEHRKFRSSTGARYTGVAREFVRWGQSQGVSDPLLLNGRDGARFLREKRYVSETARSALEHFLAFIGATDGVRPGMIRDVPAQPYEIEGMLLNAPKPATFVGARDFLVLRLLFYQSLTPRQIVSLDLPNVALRRRRLRAGGVEQVMAPDVLEALTLYLPLREDLPVKDSVALLVNRYGRRITVDILRRSVLKARQRCGIDPRMAATAVMEAGRCLERRHLPPKPDLEAIKDNVIILEP